MKLVDFRAEHGMAIKVQKAQAEVVTEITPEYCQILAHSSDRAYTGMIGDTVVFCCGRFEVWKGRYNLWALLSEDACKHMLRITRIGRRLFDLQQGSGRFEAIVRADFEQGHRWVKMLGMKLHHHEERFLPNGGDADIYVRFC